MNLQTFAGLVCTDGHFGVSFSVRPSGKDGETIQTTLIFGVSQSILTKADEDLLQFFQKYFDGKGSITIDSNLTTGRSSWIVKSWSYIGEKILPIFETNLLVGSKARDWYIMKEIYRLMLDKQHLKKNPKGRFFIMQLSLALHPETRVKEHTISLMAQWYTASERIAYFSEFKNTYGNFFQEADRLAVSQINMHPSFISGLTMGDGYLGVGFTTTGYIGCTYALGQSNASLIMVEIIKKFFGLTTAISQKTFTATEIEEERTFSSIAVSDMGVIIEKIIPHFDKYPMWGRKILEYRQWRAVAFAVKAGEHLSPEGYLKISRLGWDLHREGAKRRRDYDEMVAAVFKHKGWK